MYVFRLEFRKPSRTGLISVDINISEAMSNFTPWETWGAHSFVAT
jgi:hypothetical protein